MHKLDRAAQWLISSGLRRGLIVGEQAESVRSKLIQAGGRKLELLALPFTGLMDGSDENVGDFILLSDYAGFRYREVQAALQAAWPKVRIGGLIGGCGYHDGVLNDQVYGVRTAVTEFAAAPGLQIGVTLDPIPSWWAIKQVSPQARNARDPLKILMLTGHDGDPVQKYMADLSNPNKRGYCDRHGYQFQLRTDGFDRSRHPVWSRLVFLREQLRQYDWLWWTDVDSLIMDSSRRLESFLDEDCDLVITCDDLGVGAFHINAGQFFLRNSNWSEAFLSEWWNQTEFLSDAMQEQRALIHLLESRDLSRHVRIVTQRRFNSFPANYQRGDFLIHFAGLSNDVRIPLMRSAEQFAR